MIREWKALETIAKFDLQPLDSEEGRDFACLEVQPTIISRILEVQKKNEGFQIWFSRIATKEPEV